MAESGISVIATPTSCACRGPRGTFTARRERWSKKSACGRRKSPPAMPKQTANCFCKLELFADAEFLNDVFVRLGIVALEVVKQTTTSADHHEKTATGRVIFL